MGCGTSSQQEVSQSQKQTQPEQKKKENDQKPAASNLTTEGDTFQDGDDQELLQEAGIKYQRKENKPESNLQAFGIFEEEVAGSGDQALAVKPFVGAIVAPSNPPQMKNALPSLNLTLEYVYGYRSFDSRQNLFYTADQNCIVYMTAAIGVVMNLQNNTQKFFGAGYKENANGHNDDITALAIDNKRQLVATGEVGKNPKICVWKANDPEAKPLADFRQGRDSRAVTALSFSSDGKLLASAALDNDHTVRVFDWQTGTKIAEDKGGPDKILDLAWHPTENTFMTVGIKHVYIWKVGTNGFQGKNRGIFGKVAPQSNITSINYTSNGNAICGGTTGHVYLFNGNQLSKAVKLHNKAVHTIRVVNDVVYSGGGDNVIVISGADLTKKSEIKVTSTPRSIDVNQNGDVLVGLRDGSINVIKQNQTTNYMKSHSDGEVWGLDFGQAPNTFVTTGDDNKILVWDSQTRKCIGQGIINANPGPKRKAGQGASTLSPLPPNQQARAVAVHPQKGHVAIGINDGTWKVFAGINNLTQEIASGQQPKEWSQVMKYSPDGKYLAIGSHDNFIYLFDVDGNYSLSKTLKAHNSFIETFDFSADGKYIKSTCGAYELLFFDVANGQQIKSGASNTKDTQWQTYSTKFGWHVQGIFQGVVDFTHVNTVSRSYDQQILAIGNDWGFVTLFGFPNGEGAKGKAFKAHSEHVTSVKWSKDDKYIISTGGYDNTVMQWKKS